MLNDKKAHPKEKTILHARNKHRERYDFKQLIATCPALAVFVKPNKYADDSIDFFDPQAVKMLNKALLKHFYEIDNWDIPNNYLCPPIPGRADYLHYMADLLASFNNGKLLKGRTVKCLDIGVGANCVYPIIGTHEYEWSFVASDIDPISIQSATKIVHSNAVLKTNVELRLQPNPKQIFSGIIQKGELFDLSICNPPFHASLAEAQAGTTRKLSNLKHKKTKPILNFGGQNAELWCEGGEAKFARDMIYESKEFATSCFWFSSLISKQSSLESVYYALEKAQATHVKTIQMGQGNKISRIVAWTFLTSEQQKIWKATRW